ncbi:L-alanine-DL-glutamate epimerase-like enolase superfamily enzyme [Amorphus suaedae]
MKITSIEAIPYRLPVRREFRWNGLNQGLGHFVLVRVTTDTGLVGHGEAVPLPDWGGSFGRRAGETRATVCAMVDGLLAPALIGTDPCQISEACARMERVAVGHTYAKCAVEMALHDLWGKAVGQPIHRLLGGAVRSGVPIAHMVGLMAFDDAVAEAEAAIGEGLTALQIKGGESGDRDVALIRTLRERLGPDVVLRLDANQGYGSAKSALTVLSAFAPGELSYVEQPAVGLEHMADVTRGSLVPVVADESCWTPRDALDLVAAKGADCISIYLAKAGGFRQAAAVAAIAEAAGLPCDVNGSIESGIGNAANIQFALATPAVTLPCVIPVSAPADAHPCRVGGNYFEDDIITEAFPFRDGAMGAPDGPGLGVEVDERKLDRFRQSAI